MPTFNDLFAPNENCPYFERAAEYPFEARQNHFSLVNAGWLADCSLLVYLLDPEKVKSHLTGPRVTRSSSGYQRR